MSRAKRGFLTGLRDRSGNVLPIAAVGMLLSAALVGGGIDMSRAYKVQNRLQSACDAAALAGRRGVTTSGFNNTTAQTQADNYFTTNFDDSAQETTNTAKSFTSPDNGQTVNGTASTELNLAVMKIFGFQKFSLSVTCTASMGVGNSDVVMVLDTTGSMSSSLGSGTRISALRTAMKNFYTTVNNATSGTNARIRYGFVPFSSSINVGRLLYAENPSYLVDTYRIQSREPVEKWETSTTTDSEYKNDINSTPVVYSTTSYNSENNCNNALPSNGNWQDNGPLQTFPPNTIVNNDEQTVTTTTTVQPRKKTYYVCLKSTSDNKWYRNSYERTRDTYTYTTATSNKVFDYWNYRQIEYDVSMYKAFQSITTETGSSGSTVSSTWAGCIEERGTVSESAFAYSTTSGITPSGSWDLDLDSAPTTDNATKWAPMWPEVAYARFTSGGSKTLSTTRYGDDVSSNCPYQAQLLTEMTQSSFNAYADALYPVGSTYLDIGMIWGGRLSSPTGIFDDNVNVAPANGGEVSRHVIFMTDGKMEPRNDIQSTYGIEWWDRRITDDGSSSQTSRHSSRFRAVCEAIKAKGIRVWAISFTSGTSSDLSTCASANSYYNAEDSAELDAAFQEIAKQVGELRLTQ